MLQFGSRPVRQLEESLANDASLKASVRINPPENARLTFDIKANERIQEMIDSNFKFYKQVNDDSEFANYFRDWLFTRYRKHALSESAEPAE